MEELLSLIAVSRIENLTNDPATIGVDLMERTHEREGVGLPANSGHSISPIEWMERTARAIPTAYPKIGSKKTLALPAQLRPLSKASNEETELINLILITERERTRRMEHSPVDINPNMEGDCEHKLIVQINLLLDNEVPLIREDSIEHSTENVFIHD
jgi:hypothetical protein